MALVVSTARFDAPAVEVALDTTATGRVAITVADDGTAVTVELREPDAEIEPADVTRGSALGSE